MLVRTLVADLSEFVGKINLLLMYFHLHYPDVQARSHHQCHYINFVCYLSSVFFLLRLHWSNMAGTASSSASSTMLSGAFTNFTTLYNVCAVPWEVFSTVGDIMSIVGVFSTVGDIMINVGDIMMYVGDIMSTVGGVGGLS